MHEILLFFLKIRMGMTRTVTAGNKGEWVHGVEGEKYGEGFYEKYLLSEKDGITTLTISVDVDAEYEDHMNEGFTKGLEEVKRMAENK